MKKKHGLFFVFAVFAVLAASAIFTLAGCDTGGDAPEGDGGIPGTRAFSVSGSFDRSGEGSSSTKVNFELHSNAASPSASVMRSATAESYTLGGVLEDGDLTIRLKGSYDPRTGNWSVSAKSKSTDIIYTLDGSVDSAGGFQGASATIAVKNGDNEWVSYRVPITEGVVTITGEEIKESVDGVPSSVQGYWYTSETFPEGSASFSLLISGWQMHLVGVLTTPYGTFSDNQSCTFLDWSEQGSAYEILYCYPQYVMTSQNLAKAMADYLGLNENEITVLDESAIQALYADPPSGNPPNGRWVYVDEDSTYQGGFSPEESQKLAVFWQTGGWEKWAVSNSSSVTKYAKDKISFTSTTLSITPMVAGDGPGYTRAFDSLEALTNAAMVEEHVWGIDEGGDPVDSGVFYTITFTR